MTAASAITALQTAGEKLSRAMCDDSYDAYKCVVRQVIELIRQFYTKERTYRIVNEAGQKEFMDFDNSLLLSPVGEMVTDGLGNPIEQEFRKVEFDIEIVPQRENPFNRESVNQTMMTLWNSGVMLPQNVQSGASSIILQAMSFDGKEKLLSLIEEYKDSLTEKSMPTQENDEELVPLDLQSGEVINSDGNYQDELIPIDLSGLGGNMQ